MKLCKNEAEVDTFLTFFQLVRKSKQPGLPKMKTGLVLIRYHYSAYMCLEMRSQYLCCRHSSRTDKSLTKHSFIHKDSRPVVLVVVKEFLHASFGTILPGNFFPQPRKLVFILLMLCKNTKTGITIWLLPQTFKILYNKFSWESPLTPAWCMNKMDQSDLIIMKMLLSCSGNIMHNLETFQNSGHND